MPRNGSGVYSLPAGTEGVPNTVIESAKYNAFLSDLVSDLNTDRPIQAGGTAASTAAGARSNLGLRQLKVVTTAGSSNAYTATSGDSLTPSAGDLLIIEASFSNTGAATLNVDSTGAVAIKKWVAGTSTALASGDIASGQHYILAYDAGESAWMIVADTTTSITFPGGTVTDITGEDTTLVSGTAGAADHVGLWNSDGDLVEGPEFIDDDTMATAAADTISSSESIVAYVAAQIAAGAWTAGTAQATTSGTAWSFTGIPSTASVILMVLSGVSFDGTASFSIEIGDSGGYETTGYLSSAGTFAAGGSSTNSTAAFRLTNDVAASEAFSGVLILVNEDGDKWSIAGFIANGESGDAYGTSGGKTLSATLDRIQLTSIAGTANGDAGSVNILYAGGA